MLELSTLVPVGHCTCSIFLNFGMRLLTWDTTAIWQFSAKKLQKQRQQQQHQKKKKTTTGANEKV